MLANDLIIDAFTRVHDTVHEAVEGLNVHDLTYRPSESANSIAWLVWHLTRIQDDHIAGAAGTDQQWHTTWAKKFDLPFDDDATGYGHSSSEVSAVEADASQLLGYFDAVHTATITYLQGLTDKDYERIVDTNWDPPVTLAVRLISIISDDLQHAGQAAYVRGLLKSDE